MRAPILPTARKGRATLSSPLAPPRVFVSLPYRSRSRSARKEDDRFARVYSRGFATVFEIVFPNARLHTRSAIFCTGGGEGREREGRERETFYFIMPASVIGIARRDRNRGPSRCGGPFKSIRNVGEMRILIIYRGQPTVADFFFFLFSFFFEGNMIGANCKAFLGQLLSLSLSVCLSLSFSDLTHLIWLVRMSVIYGFLLFWKVLWFL